MNGLPKEARDRVRVSAMWIVVSAVCLGVLLMLYALLVGFDRERQAPVEAVAADGNDLVVRYVGGVPGCGDPGRVEVSESDSEVELSAYVVVRHATRHDRMCAQMAVPLITTVRLAEPLGDRVVRDGMRPGAEVPVADGLADLAPPEG
ncbi:hypothetical protein [Georgenia alba]|uniref:Uncharacterized protein n=1 Tax=Georgenia alba TaxID=2233858 RepID=A0ABW2Q9I3_9MICO